MVWKPDATGNVEGVLPTKFPSTKISDPMGVERNVMSDVSLASLSVAGLEGWIPVAASSAEFSDNWFEAGPVPSRPYEFGSYG